MGTEQDAAGAAIGEGEQALDAGRHGLGRADQRRAGRKPVARSSKGGLAEIRDWARANGYEVSDRGRIPGNVMEAYEAAN